MGPDCPMGSGDLFPINPKAANISGGPAQFCFENLLFWSKFPNPRSQISKFPESGLGSGLGPGLGSFRACLCFFSLFWIHTSQAKLKVDLISRVAGGPMPCHVMTPCYLAGHMFACHAIFCVSCRVRYSCHACPGFFFEMDFGKIQKWVHG